MDKKQKGTSDRCVLLILMASYRRTNLGRTGGGVEEKGVLVGGRGGGGCDLWETLCEKEGTGEAHKGGGSKRGWVTLWKRWGGSRWRRTQRKPEGQTASIVRNRRSGLIKRKT